MIRVPPGRAGRSWLRHRLATATRAAELLEQQLFILQREQRRVEQHARATGARWQELAHQAEQWLLRAVLAGGQRSLRLATPSEPAVVEITWTTRARVRYPVDASCELPDQSPSGVEVDTSAAVRHAREAHRDALRAAVRHGAAQAAVRAVEAEIKVTRQRLRALDQRWVPRLQEALQRLELTLEEQEHAEDITRRRALRAATRR